MSGFHDDGLAVRKARSRRFQFTGPHPFDVQKFRFQHTRNQSASGRKGKMVACPSRQWLWWRWVLPATKASMPVHRHNPARKSNRHAVNRLSVPRINRFLPRRSDLPTDRRTRRRSARRYRAVHDKFPTYPSTLLGQSPSPSKCCNRACPSAPPARCRNSGGPVACR